MLTKDEIKRWLLEIRHLNKKKRYHLNEIDNIKLDCKRIREGKTATMSLAKVQTSNISNPTEKQAIKIIYDYDDKVNYHIIEIDKVNTAIETARETIKAIYDNGIINIDEFLCIKYHYFKGMNKWETGEAMGYCERQIYRYKKSAIENMSVNVSELPCIMIT